MICLRQIKIPVMDDSIELLKKRVLQKLRVSREDIFDFIIHKKSIDARDKKNILYVYEIYVSLKNEDIVLKKNKDLILVEDTSYVFPTSDAQMDSRPIIVGSGPSGLFCSYMLAEAGYKPIILERGDSMDDRVKCVEKFFKDNVLDPNSNIQFGEGGAGTFSDGKLNTLTKDAFRQKKVFEIFVENGAPLEIMYIHNPHIGTDILRDVIKNMRNKIKSLGGEFHYRSCVTSLLLDSNKIVGVEVNHKDKIYSNCVVLAIGHSARDTFLMLHELGISMKPKNFAVGVRVEHLRSMIDDWQYGKFAKKLGSASYKLTYQTHAGRGVYSFCMCPGGFVVNASSEEGRCVVNGMSNYDREEVNSNSAIVVSVTPSDFGEDLFSGMEFQRKLEEAAYREGKSLIPVQLYSDFCMNRVSSHYGEVHPNTKGDVSFGNLRNVLPEFVSSSIMEAMPEFGKKIHGFDRGDTLMLGVESRTSSPIMIVRDDTFMSNISGLYPCGEGAGYAGGITTASVDGIKVAEAIVHNL